MKKIFIFFILIINFLLGEIINVKDKGVKGDGKTDETEIIQRIFNEISDGTSVYFPKGEYICRAVKVEGKKGITIFGDGISRIICAKKEHPNTHIFDFIDCDDLTIRDLIFDTSGADKFGGIGFYGGDRIKVLNNRFTLWPIPTGYTTDRMAIVFTGCRDIYFMNNIVENLQVESNHIKRAYFLNNKIYNPIHMGFCTATTTKGTYLEDVIISNNIIENPNGYAIGVGYDPSYEDIKICRIIISNNIIKCKGKPDTDNWAISFGTRPFVKLPSKGYWGDIQITNNLIIYNPNGLNSEFGGIFLCQPKGTNVYFQNIVIKGNQILLNGKVDYKGKVEYKYVDGTPIEKHPQWREGFGGIYINGIENSIIEGNFIRGFPVGIHIKRFKNIGIYNNFLINQQEIGFIAENSEGNNIFTNNFLIGELETPYKIIGENETDTFTPPIVKKDKISYIFDTLYPWPLWEKESKYEVEMIGEIIDFLPSGDCVIFKKEDGEVVNLRISPWKRKYAARAGIKKCKIICERLLPYGEIRVKEIKKIE